MSKTTARNGETVIDHTAGPRITARPRSTGPVVDTSHIPNPSHVANGARQPFTPQR